LEARPVTARPLKAGDKVTVRLPAEILATLDEQGEMDGLPFMPEMVSMCGRSFRVLARAERICDTISGCEGSRSMPDTVFLDNLRCDGAGHGGCAAECRIFWKEGWLQRDAPTMQAADTSSTEALLARVSRHTTQGGDAQVPRYRCQATQAVVASVPVSTRDVRSYLREYRSGPASSSHFLRVLGRAAVLQPARKLGLLRFVRGDGSSSVRTPVLDLNPGEWVRVKNRDEIEGTLNDKGKNRGLLFDREMLPFCGREFRVRQRVERLIDETNGRMIELTSDCVTLDGVVCSGERSPCRWFCHRGIMPYWREGWLERVSPGSETVNAPGTRAGTAGTVSPTPASR
jgi:hypothetical protein